MSTLCTLRNIAFTLALATGHITTAQAQYEDETIIVQVDRDLLRTLEPMVEAALLAYNEGDIEGFYKDFFSFEGMDNTAMFNMMYKDQAQGKYVAGSKKLMPDESSARPEQMDVHLLTYHVTFTKNGMETPGQVRVNFQKQQDGAMKIIQLLMGERTPKS